MQERSTSAGKWLIISVSLVVAFVLLWMFLSRPPRFEAAPPNDFCEVEMIRNDDGTPLPIQMEFTWEQGVYATLIMKEKPNRPTEIEGKFVEEYGMWMTVGNLTPLDAWPADEQKMFLVRPYRDDFLYFKAKVVSPESGRRQKRGFIGSSADFRKDAGFDGEPDRPSSIPREVRCAYTFFCQPWEAVPGQQFVVEVFLLPHAHDISSLRMVIGPKVLLWRGLITCR